MPPRIAFALLLALAGCDGVNSAYLSADQRAAHQVKLPRFPKAPTAPAAEASAVRALTVTQKLIDANPSVGARPVLITLGSPNKAIFHSGSPQAGVQMYISQGLIDACRDDGVLAAVLSAELGKIAAERAAQATLEPQGQPPIEERIGNDDHAGYGNGDGTRLMEAARREARRRQKLDQPSPDALARKILTTAGYAPEAMKEASVLLAEAARDDSLAEQLLTDRPAIMSKPRPRAELGEPKEPQAEPPPPPVLFGPRAPWE
jgi:hypothetical protein